MISFHESIVTKGAFASCLVKGTVCPVFGNQGWAGRGIQQIEL